MSQPDAIFELKALPAVIPVFPLAGVLLLPRSELPLNIFEPRYLEMVRDAMAGDGIVGMIQPSEDGDDGEPPLFAIGCAGRITAFSETEDGRYLITLKGVQRFRVEEELHRTTAYRQVKPSYEAFAGDLMTPLPRAGIDRERLIAALKAYLAQRGLEAEWSAIESAPDETLVNALAMICPFAPAEKQALLEAHSLTERTQSMIALMEFALAEAEDEDESENGPRRLH